MKNSFALFVFIFSFSLQGITQNKNYEKEIASGCKGGIIKNIKTPGKSLNFAVIVHRQAW